MATLISNLPVLRCAVTNISSTCNRNDLFDPAKILKSRVTINLPPNGDQTEEVPPPGGCTWGESLTSYGGIGSLSFRGQTRVRDLDVSRGHHHFSSGFSKYKTNSQSYQVTSLKLSDCRLNDQILPPCLGAKLSRDASLGIPENIDPYFSHKSKFEVFPHNNIERTDQTGRHPILANTRRALQEYQRKLASSRYPDVFRDITALVQKKWIPKTTEDNGDSAHGKCTSKTTEENGQIANELTTTQPMSHDKLPDILGESISEDGEQKEEEEDDENDAESDQKQDGDHKVVAGVFPCWPPSFSQVIDNKNATLKEVSIPNRPPALNTTFDSKFPQIVDRKRAGKQRHHTKSKANKSVHFSDDLLFNDKGAVPNLPDIPAKGSGFSETNAENDSLQQDILRGSQEPARIRACSGGFGDLRPYAARQKYTFLPPLLPLCQQSNTPIKRYLEDIHFKTAAHRRYHEAFPDLVPDLRDSRVHGKRSFFYGLHTSAYRG